MQLRFDVADEFEQSLDHSLLIRVDLHLYLLDVLLGLHLHLLRKVVL